MDYHEYESAVKEIEKTNRGHIAVFKTWLKEKGLSDKTINNHANNIDFYINHYLNYYDAQDAKAGCYCIDGFLGDFFIRKAMWSSIPQIKSNAASIKKFYACMLEQGVVDNDDYAYLTKDIKDGMNDWLAAMRRSDEALHSIDMFDDLI
jgi:hypothetical protein